MNKNELYSLDEALDYLNEDSLDEALDYLNESTNISRSKFLNQILNKAKSIVNKYNSQGGFRIADNGKDNYSINSFFLEGEDEIELISGSWDELKCWNKLEYKDFTKHQYGETTEVQKWYKDQEKCLADCKKAFSKYGNIDFDSGNYDDFSIHIVLNDETINSLED